MSNFEKVAASPETLGAFLVSLPIADGPWDEQFHRQFCDGCKQTCNHCPHEDKRNNPTWRLKLGPGHADHILSLSYGKDSMACLGAIEELNWPLERIVTAEVWATDTIPADPPPMMEFKKKADAVIFERWGIKVEHIRHKMTYEKMFYRPRCRGPRAGVIKGFPFTCKGRSWCKHLKVSDQISKMGITYVGIAADEPNRFHNLHARKKSPLAEARWTEAMCREWCEENGLLSPIYTDSARGGCWFCHNQGVQQLRLLRKKYPEYWALLLKWDTDSPVSFKAPSKKGEAGHSVHDYEERFSLEDQGLLVPDDKGFKWDALHQPLNYRLF